MQSADKQRLMSRMVRLSDEQRAKALIKHRKGDEYMSSYGGRVITLIWYDGPALYIRWEDGQPVLYMLHDQGKEQGNEFWTNIKIDLTAELVEELLAADRPLYEIMMAGTNHRWHDGYTDQDGALLTFKEFGSNIWPAKDAYI